MKNINIGIVGSGYVGITTGVSFAHKGFNVSLCDTNQDIVKGLNEGKCHFYEQGLDALLHKYVKQQKIKAYTDINEIVNKSDIIFICVGTPSNKDGSVDLSYIENSVKLISKELKLINKYIVIVIKSTVVPKTTDTNVRSIIETISGLKLGEYGLGMNPEFLREGSAIKDALSPDRIVIGCEDNKTKEFLSKLYSAWDCKKIYVNSRTAEFIKYTNNALLALQISASNELANVAREIGAISYLDVIEGVINDKRWNTKNSNSQYPGIVSYLKPGPGFGGSCFPKDVKALKHFGQSIGQKMQILDSIINVNNSQHLEIEKILVNNNIIKKSNKLLVLGLSFKEDTDDIRESKSIELVKSLHSKIQLFLHDPMAEKNAKEELKAFEDLNFTEDWLDKLSDMDAIVLMTNWNEYKLIEENSDLVHGLILDARGFLNKISFKRYISINKA